jgi:hypothetical protein
MVSRAGNYLKTWGMRPPGGAGRVGACAVDTRDRGLAPW